MMPTMTSTNPTTLSTDKISFNSPSSVSSNDVSVTYGGPLVGDLLLESDNDGDTVTTAVSYTSDWSGQDSTDRIEAIQEISRKLDLLEKDLSEFHVRSTTATPTRRRTDKRVQQPPAPTSTTSPTVQGSEDYDFLVQSMFDYINRPTHNSAYYNQSEPAKARQEQDIYLDYILNQGQEDEESIIDISNI